MPFRYGQKNAERKGFEPLEVVSLNGFQDRRNRPLCHLSESVLRYGQPAHLGCKGTAKFRFMQVFSVFLLIIGPDIGRY